MSYAGFMIALFVVLPGSGQFGYRVGRRVAGRRDETERSHAVILDPAIPAPLGRIEMLNIPGCWGRMDVLGRALHTTED